MNAWCKGEELVQLSVNSLGEEDDNWSANNQLEVSSVCTAHQSENGSVTVVVDQWDAECVGTANQWQRLLPVNL